ncbi:MULTISPECIES: crotonase/enoyl-CoA hydratase family protein [Streptomyces]|uniref:Crotonase/enoyl-CoA hydratase family protein n=1 Tax=Streptomyces doudnae TaxID=3075536 RepID=A0ABD5EV83_9ACTN|nr:MULTISPECIES: crotonase/enoyl-CoA hydratase family protein [unclassified Streptomyces]MDT0438646.1 crotonase/enoyl-CoA hydratase family protein [Streptomyces sp. DSM 41981]MYQ69072.1 crotonase/enoyl-CoA hydratase family protein [Streptomyces sp. SID4950]SCE51155.1 enoyl-CoA hydratase/crotonobetainyl-CoA hydratase [Streptomyces sp. SolWspMP-5a-2]
MSAAVRLEVNDGVGVLIIDRPEVRNAIDKPTADLIAAALDELDSRDDLRAAVLTGAGGIFSAGMDLKALVRTGQRPLTARGGFGIVERPPAKPLIAAVEGSALGGGFEMALACDLIVAADDARFALPEVTRGLVAAAGGVLRLPRRLPRNMAMEMVLVGAPLQADRLLELGLVNRVVPAGRVLDEALDLARAIAANAPLAVRTSKFLMDQAADWPSDEAFARQEPHTAAIRASADSKEGARAFTEKRPPVWTGM